MNAKSICCCEITTSFVLNFREQFEFFIFVGRLLAYIIYVVKEVAQKFAPVFKSKELGTHNVQ